MGSNLAPDATGVILVRRALLTHQGLLHLIDPRGCDRCFSSFFTHGSWVICIGGLMVGPWLFNLKRLVDTCKLLHCYRVSESTWMVGQEDRTRTDQDTSQLK